MTGLYLHDLTDVKYPPGLGKVIALDVPQMFSKAMLVLHKAEDRNQNEAQPYQD